MPAAKLSKAVQSILDAILQNSAEVMLSKETMLAVCGVEKECRVKDLTQTQLLSLALIDSHNMTAQLLENNDTLTKLVNKMTPQPNRAQRRAQGKLLLP